MSNTPLTVKEHDYLKLGDHLHHKLSWSPHQISIICTIIYNKVKHTRMLGYLNRNLYHAPQHIIKEYTYKTLVLPSMDYNCSAIWDPYTK